MFGAYGNGTRIVDRTGSKKTLSVRDIVSRTDAWNELDITHNESEFFPKKKKKFPEDVENEKCTVNSLRAYCSITDYVSE